MARPNWLCSTNHAVRRNPQWRPSTAGWRPVRCLRLNLHRSTTIRSDVPSFVPRWRRLWGIWESLERLSPECEAVSFEGRRRFYFFAPRSYRRLTEFNFSSAAGLIKKTLWDSVSSVVSFNFNDGCKVAVAKCKSYALGWVWKMQLATCNFFRFSFGVRVCVCVLYI